VMRRSGSLYALNLRLLKNRSGTARALGQAHIPRRLKTLRLRVYVSGVGHSNIVRVRVRR